MSVDLLTPGFCAEALKVHRATIGRMITERQLPAVLLSSGKTRHVYRIPRDEFEKFLQSRMTVRTDSTTSRGRKRG